MIQLKLIIFLKHLEVVMKEKEKVVHYFLEKFLESEKDFNVTIKERVWVSFKGFATYSQVRQIGNFF